MKRPSGHRRKKLVYKLMREWQTLDKAVMAGRADKSMVARKRRIGTILQKL